MVSMLYYITILLTGLLMNLLLFYRFPFLRKSDKNDPDYKVSIIIPARNEEINLSFLLEDLQHQSYPIHEVICVDDCSTDHTAQIISSFGTELISIIDKPEDWMGKSWACQKGAEASDGDMLLFLDADVRMKPEAVACLIQAYDENQCVISLQPYHWMKKRYEQFSLFFNLIQIAANGTTAVFKDRNAGLFGPVILIPKDCYHAVGGHSSIKNSIVDDLAMGESLKKNGFLYKLFLGGEYISFRMYPGCFSELRLGWTKNYATGAQRTPKGLLLMVFLWITSCVSVIQCIIQSIITFDLRFLIVSVIFYFLWVFELYRTAHRIGQFKKCTLICFPICLFFFLWIFIQSIVKKLFHRTVFWKDRSIKLER